MFVGYHVDDFNGGVPVAVGADRDAVQGQTIQRVLALGIGMGEIATREVDLTESEAADLAAALDAWFTSKGITH